MAGETGDLIVTVGRSDILEGDLRRCEYCPVALAVARALRERGFPAAWVCIGVNGGTLKLAPHDGRVTFALPDHARRHILLYLTLGFGFLRHVLPGCRFALPAGVLAPRPWRWMSYRADEVAL